MGEGAEHGERPPVRKIRLSRQAALVGGGLGLAATLPLIARARAEDAAPGAGSVGAIDRQAVEAVLPYLVTLAEGTVASGGAAYQDPPVAPSPPLALDAYAGIYDSAYAGPAEVAVEDDGLVLRVGPEPRSFALTHFDRDMFTYALDLEPPAPLTGATFVNGPDGRAATLHLDYFAGNGQGTFPRRGND